MHIGDVGPYKLDLAADLPLQDDVHVTDDPPMHHLSWVAQPGLAFAMQVIVAGSPERDAQWNALVAAVQKETAETFQAGASSEIDGEIGPGIVFEGRQLRKLGRYERPAIVEHYVGEVHDDVIDLVYRFHADHLDQIDSWRRLFHSIAFSAFIERGAAMARAGQVPPPARKRSR